MKNEKLKDLLKQVERGAISADYAYGLIKIPTWAKLPEQL